MTIARQAGQWALAAGEGADESVRPDRVRGDPGLVYSRAARAVRLTLMLQTRLLKELPDLGRAQALVRIDHDQSRRKHAHRMTVRAIRAEHDEAEAVEHLSDEAWDRLSGEDLSDDLGERPLVEIVARICRDLDLSPDWGAWAFNPPSTAGEASGPEDPAPASGEDAAAPPPSGLQREQRGNTNEPGTRLYRRGSG